VTVVEVWLVPVSPGAAEWLPLTGAEREQIASLGFADDRDRAATARVAARRLAPTGAHVNWSHSGAWVALAVAQDRPVGVDIERIPPEVPAGALALLGIGSLEEFVAREAAGKAVGAGLTAAPTAGVTVRRLHAPVGYAAAVAAPGDDWTVALSVHSGSLHRQPHGVRAAVQRI
jgi:hypothetical protein